MLSHASIWKAIDRLANQHDLSPSALAKRAGLDPTTFNPSKRFKADGKPRWPSTESIAKILDVMNASPGHFFSENFEALKPHNLAAPEQKSFSPTTIEPDMIPYPSGTIPLWLEESAAGNILASLDGSVNQINFDKRSSRSSKRSQSRDQKQDQDYVDFPGPPNEPVFALAICNDALEPLYHCGDTLLVSPTGNLRCGDRIIAKSHAGLLGVYSLIRATARNLIVHRVQEPKIETILSLKELRWTARVLWASQ